MVQVLCSVSGQCTKCFEVVSSLDHFLQSQGLSGANVQCLVNGRSCQGTTVLTHMDSLLILPRLNGGKGGFGSMLRAIGAQIEATTNNDACRDLSGKRLRDVKCEKLLREWADKQAKDKVDRRDRKRQRLERILDGPSRMKSEDNTYITEMRNMSGSVEDAIAKAISEDTTTTKTQGPVPKKWFGDSDSSDDEEAGSSSSTEDVCEGASNSERENDPNKEPEDISEQIEVPVEEERGMIRITYDEECSVDEASTEGEIKEFEEQQKEVISHNVEEQQQEVISHNVEEQQKEMTAQNKIIIQQPSSPTKHSPLTPPKSPEILPENPPVIAAENSPEITPEKSPERAPRLTDVDLSNYDSVESLLSVGADNLKSILSERGLKCGGTALQRAERLFSVKGLNKDQINPALLATAGKRKKRKIKT